MTNKTDSAIALDEPADTAAGLTPPVAARHP